MLGTFIVEGPAGEDGMADCLCILTDTEAQLEVVEQLVEIADYFGFDGYLLNFEVNLVTPLSKLQSKVEPKKQNH